MKNSVSKEHQRLKKLNSLNNKLLVSGYTATQLVNIAGSSPCYIYDREELSGRVADFRRLMPRELKLHYAIKANPMPALVAHMARSVDGLDVASPSGNVGCSFYGGVGS